MVVTLAKFSIENRTNKDKDSHGGKNTWLGVRRPGAYPTLPGI